MFGSLKKRLQEAVEKVSKTIAKEEPERFEPVEMTDERILEEIELKKEEIREIKEKEEEFERIKKDKEKIMTPDERMIPQKSLQELIEETPVVEQIDKRMEELEELKGKVIEEKLPHAIESKKAAREEKRSLFGKITEKKLSESDIENILKELNIALLENDVAVEVAERISEDVKVELLGATVKRGRVEDTIKEALSHAMLDVMSQERIDLKERINSKNGPFTIMIVGFNGTGKTTSLCKLAFKLKEFNPVLAAADTFRAASIEQLEEHGRRLGLRVIKHSYGSDSAAVIFDAKKHAAASGSKLVLADTAGRSHSNVNLMDELKKVARVNQPDLKILVLDSVTGNDIYDQCKLFNDAVGVDAIILTKADVYDRGGAALSAAYTLKKPILYIGIGQEYEDLKEFKPEEIVKNLIG
ncbi:MAG: signal recognition particle-docking protein FtsY [Candidatus Aenigmarchaeota archaeon]|nr:signal recognition particle-docking protein FtsY [Candidatus Aenigmarchaeota archaeon]